MAQANCQNQLASKFYNELDEFIAGYKFDKHDNRRKGNIIQILHKAQHIFGYLPAEVQQHVADRVGVSLAHISGIVSFYNYFTVTPKGKYKIAVCMGTACFVRGSGEVLAQFEEQTGIKAGKVSDDGKFSIDAVRCIGACGLAPVLTINEKVYGSVKPEQVKDILANYY
ncbi:MAG: NAD(P)H-dependent oxidoreductase subunit E [Spirochaetaceae bacterium]|nr:NAD(P)H-dependent oxidoreductase subunit E [Spirochaetaceae bacterium]